MNLKLLVFDIVRLCEASYPKDRSSHVHQDGSSYEATPFNVDADRKLGCVTRSFAGEGKANARDKVAPI